MARVPGHQGFRQSMAWLHTWAGLLPGWLLFVIFLFGTSAFFQQEISQWMRPGLPRGPVTAEALERAGTYLKRHAANAESWTISLPPERGGDPLSLSWQMGESSGGERGSATLSPADGGEIKLRETLGGWFLYRFHFDLHYMPVMWARYLICIAALAMLVAIVSGIVTHKKIFADFFMLRFGKGQRSWLDAHNVSAVLALPFHLMITYTGLATLLFTLMPWAIEVNFPNRDTYLREAFPQPAEGIASGVPARTMPLGELLSRAQTSLGGRVSFARIQYPGDASARFLAYPATDRLGAVRRYPVVMSAVSGVPLDRAPQRGAAQATHRVMINLHAGRFADPVLRWLYFLSGAAGTVMVGTGLVLWTVKRRAKLPSPDKAYFGLRLAERLNIAVLAGAPASIAVYFHANRLLPLDLPERADWEIHCLFLAWGALSVWGLARPVKRAWGEGFALCALLYALVPVSDVVTTGQVSEFSFDAVMLVLAAASALASWRISRHRPRMSGRRKSRPVEEKAA